MPLFRHVLRSDGALDKAFLDLEAEDDVQGVRRFVGIDPDEAGRFASRVLPGFSLRPEWLWQTPLPDVIGTLRELGVQF